MKKNDQRCLRGLISSLLAMSSGHIVCSRSFYREFIHWLPLYCILFFSLWSPSPSPDLFCSNISLTFIAFAVPGQPSPLCVDKALNACGLGGGGWIPALLILLFLVRLQLFCPWNVRTKVPIGEWSQSACWRVIHILAWIRILRVMLKWNQIIRVLWECLECWIFHIALS